jgi:hypothetical protein
MNKIKLSLAALLLAVSAVISGPMMAQDEIIGGDCVYSEFRSQEGVCYGATTRLCQGPPECSRDAS